VKGSGVYEDSMPRSIDPEIERLLTGRSPEGSSLAVLVPLVEHLRTERDRRPVPEQVAILASRAAEISLAMAGSPAYPAPSVPARRRRLNLTPKLAIPLAFVLLFSGLTGAAFAADGAVPGDRLYALDLALEKVGIGNGGVDERLAEAAELASRQMPVEALAHAAAAIFGTSPEHVDTAEGLAGLEHAIDQLTVERPGPSDDVHGDVAEMLQWMIDNIGLIDDPEAEPGAFGRGVADMARQIGADPGPSDDGSSGEGTENTGQANSGFGGPPQGVPGPPSEGIPPNRP
jgi:hypothetical protein